MILYNNDTLDYRWYIHYTMDNLQIIYAIIIKQNYIMDYLYGYYTFIHMDNPMYNFS